MICAFQLPSGPEKGFSSSSPHAPRLAASFCLVVFLSICMTQARQLLTECDGFFSSFQRQPARGVGGKASVLLLESDYSSGHFWPFSAVV